MRKKIILVLLILSTLFLCSCTAKEEEEGEAQVLKNVYTEEEMNLLSLEGREGVFVKTKEDTYAMLIGGFSGYDGDATESSLERYLWIGEESRSLVPLIPEVSKNTPLIIAYNKNMNMNLSYTIEKYAFKGYTIGCHIFKDIDNSLVLRSDGALETSNLGKTVSQISDEDEYVITSINDEKELPVGNVDNNMQILLGLEQGKRYKVGLLKGTKYIEIETVADSLVFQSEKLIVLENPYKTTKKGYFVVNLPENMEEGYYYFSGLGMFKYVG